MKPSGGIDETWKMVTTVLTRVAALSDQSRSELSGRDRGRYDCDHAILRVHRTVSDMRSSDRLDEVLRLVTTFFSWVVIVTLLGQSRLRSWSKIRAEMIESRNPSGLPYRLACETFGLIE